MDEDAFHRWLVQKGYSKATARSSARGIRRLRERRVLEQLGPTAAKKVAAADMMFIRRYSDYLASTGASYSIFDELVLGLRLPPLEPLRSAKKREARGFTTAEWQRICAQLDVYVFHPDGPDPEAVVLRIQTVTGLRTGDALRIERKAVVEAIESRGVFEIIQKGGERVPKVQMPIEGAPELWAVLYEHWDSGRILAEWVCPASSFGDEAGYGAYKRVQRYFKEICEEANVSGRCNLHRIRRTVAVKALQLTKDAEAVRQMLGHTKLKSTMVYVDEPRPDAVAELQRRLRGVQ